MKADSTGKMAVIACLLLLTAMPAVRATSGLRRAVPAPTGTAYYVSSTTGNDTLAGTSPDTAWRTLRRASEVTLGGGDALLLQYGSVFVDDPLTLNSPDGAVLGAYPTGSAEPRPLIQLPRTTEEYTSCVSLVEPGNNVHVQDIHVAGCARGIHWAATPGATRTGWSMVNVVLRDIKTPFRAYRPPNPAWSNGILIEVNGHGGATVNNVTVANSIGLRLDVFYSSTGVAINGLDLAGNTVAKCGGNCISMGATNMRLRDSVFLRDTPDQLFLYGTTDVIIGTVSGDNSITDCDFNARGEYMGGPDGCAVDFETSASGFTISGCTFSRSFGAGIMVFGHATTSHGLVLSNNVFEQAGCLQPRNDQGGIAFMCPGGNQPSGVVENNTLTTCGKTPAFFESFPNCSGAMTFSNNVVNNLGIATAPMPSINPPAPTSNATSGSFPVLPDLGDTPPPNAVVRYTLDGSRPTEASPVVPAAGIMIKWPGPVVAINMRTWADGMAPSVTNGIVLEDNYIMGRMAPNPSIDQVDGSFDSLAVTATSATAVGWGVDRALRGGGLPPVNVSITINGTEVANVVALVPRPDLPKAGVAPNAAHGFDTALPAAAAAALQRPGRHTVDAWVVGSPGSMVPWRLPSSPKCVCAGASCPC